MRISCSPELRYYVAGLIRQSDAEISLFFRLSLRKLNFVMYSAFSLIWYFAIIHVKIRIIRP